MDHRLLDLVDPGGITVTTAAGNVGNESGDRATGTINHLAPWLLTTANIAVRRDPERLLMNARSRTGPVEGLYRNLAKPDLGAPGTGIYLPSADTRVVATGSGDPPASVVAWIERASHSPWLLSDRPNEWLKRYEGSPPNEGCAAFPAGFFTNRVAWLPEALECSGGVQALNARNAGAVGVVIRTTGFPDLVSSEGQPSDLPVYVAHGGTGGDLNAFIGAEGTQVGSDGREVKIAIGPGRSTYETASGTSLAAPHVAGAAALILEQRPDLSPMEVASLLKTTTQSYGFKPNGSDPWDADDVGGGMLDVSTALSAPLVMHEDVATMLAADPEAGGDPTALNLPSLREMDCNPSCTFTRRFRNAGDGGPTWNVEPALIGSGWSIAVDPEILDMGPAGVGSEVEVSFTVTPPEGRPDEIQYGWIRLDPHNRMDPTQRLSVAIRGDSRPLSGFLLDYAIDGATGSGTQPVVLTPVADGGVHPSVYAHEHENPPNVEEPDFVAMTGYYGTRFPDGIEAGNTDWQGLGTDHILTWDAFSPFTAVNRYNQSSWQPTLYTRGKRLAEVLDGIGGVVGAAIRTLPDETRKLGAITYEPGTRTLHYIERNWHPGIVYPNDLEFHPQENPDGWELIHKDVHQTHIASGQNLRLRSGVYFSDDGTRAVGLLRSNNLATSDQPWAEVAFDRSSGFDFHYRQTGRVKHSESARWVSACIETVPETVPTTCSMPSDSDTGEADKWRRYENASTVDLETIHPPDGGQLPWAELADHALVAIDFRGNEVSRLSKRLVELNWMDEAEVSASGSYTKSEALQCQSGQRVSRTITQTASGNTLAG